jgi:hypothetical protein
MAQQGSANLVKRKRLRNALRHHNPSERELRQWRGVAVGHMWKFADNEAVD